MIGQHLLLDQWGGDLDPTRLEQAMRAAADAAGATILSGHFHPFDGGGVTGVLLLAESHITVHTWPEHGLAAFDLFLCGETDVTRAADMLDAALKPDRTARRTVPRGQRYQASQPA
ncbi:MAG: adenosylmethionine decarboxylase [Pseudomonadota bacterium]